MSSILRHDWIMMDGKVATVGDVKFMFKKLKENSDNARNFPLVVEASNASTKSPSFLILQTAFINFVKQFHSEFIKARSRSLESKRNLDSNIPFDKRDLEERAKCLEIKTPFSKKI